MTTRENDPKAKVIPHELIASQERKRVPDFEQDEDIIRVSFDNAICTKLRALHFCKIPHHSLLDGEGRALAWLNISGVFSIEHNGEQVSCEFVFLEWNGGEVSCVLSTGESFLLNNGVPADMRLCIFQPAVFDELVAAAFQQQKEFSREMERRVKESNKTRKPKRDLSLDVREIERSIAGVNIKTMKQMEQVLLSYTREFRQVMTPSAEQPGSCTTFFEWLATQIKSRRLTHAVRFNPDANQVQLSLGRMKLDGPLHLELIQEYTRVFGTTQTALFPSLAEASDIVRYLLPNIIEERVEDGGRVQRNKLTFDHLGIFQGLIKDGRVPRIRLGKTVVDISDDTRVMTPTIYISF